MFDISWTEILLIAVIAVVVIGPKEMPQVMRSAARYLRAFKSMLRDFRRQIDDVVDAEEMREMRQELEKMGIHDIPADVEKQYREAMEEIAQSQPKATDPGQGA